MDITHTVKVPSMIIVIINVNVTHSKVSPGRITELMARGNEVESDSLGEEEISDEMSHHQAQ